MCWEPQFSSVAQSCPTLCDPMNRRMPGLPVHRHLLGVCSNSCPCPWLRGASLVPALWRSAAALHAWLRLWPPQPLQSHFPKGVLGKQAHADSSFVLDELINLLAECWPTLSSGQLGG